MLNLILGTVTIIGCYLTIAAIAKYIIRFIRRMRKKKTATTIGLDNGWRIISNRK